MAILSVESYKGEGVKNKRGAITFSRDLAKTSPNIGSKVLLVDEMSLGLAPIIVERLLPIVRDIANETGAGVLIVEQHVHLALEVADRAYVMSHGEIVLEGSAQELMERQELLEASYLGGEINEETS